MCACCTLSHDKAVVFGGQFPLLPRLGFKFAAFLPHVVVAHSLHNLARSPPTNMRLNAHCCIVVDSCRLWLWLWLWFRHWLWL